MTDASQVRLNGSKPAQKAKNKGKSKMSKSRSSEVHAYGYIKERLKELGWNTRNPLRVEGGQVFTQQECLEDDEFKKYLGLKRPENVVKVSESKYYVIEAKATKSNIGLALKEAEEEYANPINESKSRKVLFISGIAGNDDEGYVVKSKFLIDGVWQSIRINEQEVSSLLSPQICSELLYHKTAEIADLPVDEALFLKTAEKINEILHNGAINKNYRAKVMAALLLALIDEAELNVDANPIVLIRDINSRAENVLIKNQKSEFYNTIKITPPPSKDNHVKFKTALVRTIEKLNGPDGLNIRSAMNSGTDVLGKFYEVFLKYGNGAKEIGIVLTPRHITRFAAEALDVNVQDIVYDPTCGTGGFLVAAFDRAKKQANGDIVYFKNNGLFGIDQDPDVAALAIVNMIFRGDGKNNIIEGNCFSKSLLAERSDEGRLGAHFCNNDKLPKVRSPAATKVLMNPPFAKKDDEMEYKFVQHALKQMQVGKLLFSVLPISAMFEAGDEKRWRKDELLKENTLLSVITFPPELFYPIGVHTLGIVVKKGERHPDNQSVLWCRATRDGFVKVKGKRLPSDKELDDFQELVPLLRAFIQNPACTINSVPQFVKVAPIDFDDPLFELVPEAYLDSPPVSAEEISSDIDRLMREQVSFIVRFAQEERYEN